MRNRRDNPPWVWAGLLVVLLAATVSMRVTRPVVRAEVGVTPIGLRIDVNHAGADTLELLPQIGPAIARRIVQRRDAVGGFVVVEGLDAVRGIGPKTLAGVRPWVVCGPVEAADDTDRDGLR